MLEHHPHPMTILEDMFRKLKKGQKLILFIPFERHGKGKFQYDLKPTFIYMELPANK